MFQQLLKDIKTPPEDVIDSLKDKKKKDVLNKSKVKMATGAKTDAEKEEERLKNKALILDYVNQERDACLRDQTLESNLRVAYNIIFSNFCDKLKHKSTVTFSLSSTVSSRLIMPSIKS